MRSRPEDQLFEARFVLLKVAGAKVACFAFFPLIVIAAFSVIVCPFVPVDNVVAAAAAGGPCDAAKTEPLAIAPPLTHCAHYAAAVTWAT